MQLIGILLVVVIMTAGAWYSLDMLKTTGVDMSANTEATSSVSGILDQAKEAARTIESPMGSKPTTNHSSVAVYDGITIDSGATKLDLSGRGLSGSLKAEIRQLKDLEVIDISNNKFTGLPAEIGQLTNLTSLDMSGNPLTGLPYELGNLKKLQRLDLRGTNYSKSDLEIIKKGLSPNVEILVD